MSFLPPNPTTTFLQTRSLDRATGALVPFYVYPADVFTNADYNTVIDLAKEHHRVPIYVILNPASGPGTVADGNYAAAVRRLRGAGISVLGYVHASYAVRAIAEVKADIDTWLSLYPTIDGLFVDEMTNDDSVPHRAYFTELARYGHSKRLFPIVANPGAGVGIVYFTQECADVIVIHETAGYPVEATIKGDFDGGYMDVDYRRRAALVYDETVVTASVQTMSKYVGMVYVTTDDLPNPWDTLSTELGDLLTVLDGGTV